VLNIEQIAENEQELKLLNREWRWKPCKFIYYFICFKSI